MRPVPLLAVEQMTREQLLRRLEGDLIRLETLLATCRPYRHQIACLRQCLAVAREIRHRGDQQALFDQGLLRRYPETA